MWNVFSQILNSIEIGDGLLDWNCFGVSELFIFSDGLLDWNDLEFLNCVINDISDLIWDIFDS